MEPFAFLKDWEFSGTRPFAHDLRNFRENIQGSLYSWVTIYENMVPHWTERRILSREGADSSGRSSQRILDIFECFTPAAHVMIGMMQEPEEGKPPLLSA
jgi:hypothetical protein